MIKKDNGQGEMADLVATIQALAKGQQNLLDRIEDMESKRGADGRAKLFMAQMVYDTDRRHLPEMTSIPLRAVRPYSLADMSAAILDPEVQCGTVTLGQIRRESIYRHLRSVKGNLLEKGAEQVKVETTSNEGDTDFEEANMGKGM
jgi:hypothetical protein